MKYIILFIISCFISGMTIAQVMRSETNMTVTQGTTLYIDGNLNINAGEINLNAGATLSMGNNRTLSVNNGGQLNVLGSSLLPATITSSGYFGFDVNSGGTIGAHHAVFERMGEMGVHIKDGATINPVHAFQKSTFQNGIIGGTLLIINNGQNITIQDAYFPPNYWGGNYNVVKSADQGMVTFQDAFGGFAGTLFEKDSYGRVFWGDQLITHSIPLPAGWSSLSSYIMPVNNSIEDVFAPVLPDFIIAQTMSGIYYPAGPVNTIGDWRGQSGYKVKMSDAATLPIIGNEETNKIFDLVSGWNLLPVISNTSVNTSTLVSGLGANLQIIKEIAGSKVYWPAFGIYSLTQLTPGKAYFVRMNAGGTLTFPNNIADNTFIPEEPIKEVATPWNTINRTAASHIIGIDNVAMDELQEGDILGAFTTTGLLVGNVLIQNINENQSLYAFADDQLTAETDGFIDGQPMIFKLFRPSTGEEFTLDVAYNPEMSNNNGLFATEGISAIKGLSVINTGLAENFATGLFIYPNPTDGKVTIGGIAGIEQILVMAADGSVVMRIHTVIEGDQVLDLSGLPSGLYQVQIRTSLGVVTRKVVKGQ